MRIWDLYKLAIDMGIATDPRGQAAVLQLLEDKQNNYYEAPSARPGSQEDLLGMFDKELLHNPYPDTRVLGGTPETEVKHLFAGIDVGTAELMLVDRLNQKGAGIDLVMAHHPEGIALTTLAQAMGLQADMFACCGVPINAAEHILAGEAEKTTIDLVTGNYNRAVDAARLLELPFMCVHTPTDNLVQHYWEQRFAQEKPATLGQIMDMLNGEPEYIEATKFAAGPQLLAGSPEMRPGKIMVDMTGGTDAGPKLYKRLGAAGVGTLVAMHMSNGTLEVMRENHINVILAGHMSSDSLGLNLYLDAVEAQGVKVTAGAGLTRFSRRAS